MKISWTRHRNSEPTQTPVPLPATISVPSSPIPELKAAIDEIGPVDDEVSDFDVVAHSLKSLSLTLSDSSKSIDGDSQLGMNRFGKRYVWNFSYFA